MHQWICHVVRRRETGVLGAPERLQETQFSLGLVFVMIVLGAYIPLFGLSLIIVLLLEKLVFRRISKVRHWLGLNPPKAERVNTLASVILVALLTINGCSHPMQRKRVQAVNSRSTVNPSLR